MAKSDSKLKKIKSGVVSRGFALAKMSASVGAKAAGHAIGGLLSKTEKQERLKQLLIEQAKFLSGELGQLKGSLMKAGQLLSMYGENFLPPEANQFLKGLQNQSITLEWPPIEKVLLKELGAEKLALLDIDHEAIGAASLGQVHQAVERSTGRKLALKVQYPGVERAIDGDIKVLKSVLGMMNFLPTGTNFDELFDEVRNMLKQECDYELEAKRTEDFREWLKGDDRYVVPQVVREFSTRKILTTTLEVGDPVDSPTVLNLPQESRDFLGLAALELFYRELFELQSVQTDPHLGNYRIRNGKQLVLFDFGAVREFEPKFLRPYYEMVQGSLYQDRNQVENGATDLGFMFPDDSAELKKAFFDLCVLIMEPYQGNSYDFGKSDLAQRAVREGKQLAFKFKLRAPPREIVFLDRKISGIFVFLSVLGAKLECRGQLETALKKGIANL